MNEQQRLDYIHMFMVDAMGEIPIMIEWIPRDTWAQTTLPHGNSSSHRAMGISVPQLCPYPGGGGTYVCIQICPEAIVNASLGLDESQFHDYLMSLRVHAHLHVIHRALPYPLSELTVLDEQRELSEDSFDRYQKIVTI